MVLERWGDGVALAKKIASPVIDGHDQLITYIRDPEQYPPPQVAEYEQSVNDLCHAAIAANTKFQQSIAQ